VHEARDAGDRKIGSRRIIAARRGILGETDRFADVEVGPRAKSLRCFPPIRDAQHNFLLVLLPDYGLALSKCSDVCDTGGMGAVKPMRRMTTETDVATEKFVATERPWNVVVWDDPVTPMTVVVVIFKKIFGYSNNKCTQLMLRVHNDGKAIVWSGPRERAESYCVKLQVAGLQSTIEQDQ
jgi:ATP-dependent Clp protease adaptor protein ClpS